MKNIEIGKKISFVTIKERLETDTKDNQRFLCLCDCGKETIKWGSTLRKALSGRSITTCIDCQYIKQSEMRRKFDPPVVGDNFGKWTVIGVSTNKTKDGRILYETRCFCGALGLQTESILRKGRSKGCYDCTSMTDCRFCGCLNHENIDLETTDCDHLGFCPNCDRFEIRDNVDVSKLSAALVWAKSRAKSKRRFRVSKNR